MIIVTLSYIIHLIPFRIARQAKCTLMSGNFACYFILAFKVIYLVRSLFFGNSYELFNIFKLMYSICVEFFQPFKLLKYVPFEFKIMYVLFVTN